MRRLSPQPVVSFWPLVMEKMGCRHQGHAGTRICSPDVAPPRQSPEPSVLPADPHATGNAALSARSRVRSSRITSKQFGIGPSFSKPTARGGDDRCCDEVSRSLSVSSAIGPVICPRRSPAANTPWETPHGFQIPNFRPYFSSSLTLSIRGAVSPARHVLTRPRPHPVFRQGSERIIGSVFMQESHEDRGSPMAKSLS